MKKLGITLIWLGVVVIMLTLSMCFSQYVMAHEVNGKTEHKTTISKEGISCEYSYIHEKVGDDQRGIIKITDVSCSDPPIEEDEGDCDPPDRDDPDYGIAGVHVGNCIVPHTHDSSGNVVESNVRQHNHQRSDRSNNRPVFQRSTDDSTMESISSSQGVMSCDEITEDLFDWSVNLHTGWNLLGIPTVFAQMSTVADFYQYLHGSLGSNPNFFIRFQDKDGQWLEYRGKDRKVGWTSLLTPNFGLMIHIDYHNWFGIECSPLENAETIELREGENLVGFPRKISHLRRPSDFLSDKITSIKRTWEGRVCVIEKVNDCGDIFLREGEALILIATESHTLNLSQGTPAAPAARATVTMRWGQLKKGYK